MICQCDGNTVLLDKIKQKIAVFCVIYELLFYRNITKLLRFPVFLLGMMV